jgi:hypothetical protein
MPLKAIVVQLFAWTCLFICQIGLASDSPVQIEIVLPDTVGHKYRKTVFGTNCLLLSRPFNYTLPGFIEKYNEAGKPFFRFPGGTPSNFYNFETGLLDITDEDNASRRSRNVNTNNSIISRHGEAGFPAASFFEFAAETGAQYSISINMTSMAPADNKRFMEYVRDLNGNPRYIELGNELYFGTYADYIEDGITYVQEARAQAAAIREVFPDIKIGALIPSQIYTDESFLPEPDDPKSNRQGDWLTELAANQDFFDSVVIHLYSKIGMGSSTPESEYLPYEDSYRYAISHVDGEFNPAMQKIRALFPEKDVWVTEYHVGGFSSNLNKFRLRYSYLGTFYAAYFFFNLLDTPEVTVSHWHSFIQMITWPNSPDDQTVLGTMVSFGLFKLLGDISSSHSYISPVGILGQHQYQGLGSYQDSYPEISAYYLHGDDKGTVVIINKLATQYALKEISISGIPDSYPLNISSIEQVRPLDSLSLDEALQNEMEMTVVNLSMPQDGTIDLPPYSMTFIHIKQDWLIAGLPEPFRVSNVSFLSKTEQLRIRFQAYGGYAYKLMQSNSLESDSWEQVNSVEVRRDQEIEMIDPGNSTNSRFYRIDRQEL